MAAEKNLLAQLLRRWRAQARMDFMWMTRDFPFFCICVVSDIITDLAGIAVVFLLAERFAGIGEWSREQILFMLGYGAVVESLLGMFFGYNVLAISRRVGRGQMDHVLIQPQPLWMVLLAEGFTPFSGCWAFFVGAGLCGWAVYLLGLPLTAGWLLALALNLAASCLVVLGFAYLWGALAFWSPVSAEESSSRATRFASNLKSFPLDGVDSLLAGFLLVFLPVGFVAWYPSRALIGVGDGGAWWGTPVFALALALVALAAFRKGLKHYERTGSQRYLPWGHRS